MKLSYNWLKELVPQLTANPEEVAVKLTMHAYETNVAGHIAIDPAVTVVKIINVAAHPNADRLRLATVTDGKRETQLICGAPNIAVGQVVPYAPPGARVYDVDGEALTIKEAVIRGVKSPGMLGSARDLGLGSDHGGIFVLPSDTPLGTRLVEHIPHDTILETDMTPNRAHDSLSHIGVAREIASLYELSTQEPSLLAVPPPVSTIEGLTVVVANAADTPRYMNILLKGADSGVLSPLWLQARLMACGLRPINAIVDSTNYVLLEWGQPTHAFDADKLPGKTTGVRPARTGEKLQLLDGQERTLPEGSLVITSDETPIALAGIMGGTSTAVGEGTSRLLLEIANFRPFAIQQTAATLALRTEASQRFAKGISPHMVSAAAVRLVGLLQEVTGATVQSVIDYYPHPVTSVVVDFSPAKVSRFAGVPVTTEQSRQILTRLRCVVDTVVFPWRVTIPLDRLDLTGEHDLLEEVIRVIGLQNIPTKPVAEPAEWPPQEPASVWREVIRDWLVTHGFTETYNVAFEPDKLGHLFDSSSGRITITNPLAPEQASLRTSLLPGLAANFMTNKDDFHKKFTGQTRALFEMGQVYLPDLAAIREEEHLAGMMVGETEQIKTLIKTLFEELGLAPTPDTLLFVGEVPSDVVAIMKYRLPVAAFVINATRLFEKLPPREYPRRRLAELMPMGEPVVLYQPFSRYPSVLRDISFLVEEDVTVEQAQEIIERIGGSLVVDSELFDELSNEDSGQKSLAFHVDYQALDHTLTTEEIKSIHNRIIKALEAEIGAEIR